MTIQSIRLALSSIHPATGAVLEMFERVCPRERMGGMERPEKVGISPLLPNEWRALDQIVPGAMSCRTQFSGTGLSSLCGSRRGEASSLASPLSLLEDSLPHGFACRWPYCARQCPARLLPGAREQPVATASCQAGKPAGNDPPHHGEAFPSCGPRPSVRGPPPNPGVLAGWFTGPSWSPTSSDAGR